MKLLERLRMHPAPGDQPAVQAMGSARGILAAIVDNSDDAIISKSLEGKILTWNKSAERIFGYTAEEAVGQSISMLIPADRLDEEYQIQLRLRRGERVDHYETTRVAKNGGLIDVSLTISPVKDADGRIVGISKIARDITERKRLDEALRKAKETAELADKAKDHFIAVLSHELRTPLNPVLIAVQELESGSSLSVDQRSMLAMIRRNVELEARLIDDLLDVTRIANGKLQMVIETLDLHQCIHDVIMICDNEITSRGQKLTLELSAANSLIPGDSARVQQVLWNLVKNAVKFTPHGGEIRIRTVNPTCGNIQVVVQDSGCGIDGEALPRIFEAFEQGEKNVTRRFGGLGLGLSISKSLVRLHGGSLTAASAGKGAGATFTLVLPAETSNLPRLTNPIHPDDAAAPALAHILLVEDHLDSANALSSLLSRAGYSITIAATVAAAVDCLKSERFDGLISDIGLPDGTGLDVMRHVRAVQPHVKGIVVSGYGMEDDVFKSKAAGFVSHLTKPININQLKGMLTDLFALTPINDFGSVPRV